MRQNNGTKLLPGCGNAPACIPGLLIAAQGLFLRLRAALRRRSVHKRQHVKVTLEGRALCGNEPAAGLVGYFGYKVLAVSYDGTLIMSGYKGVATSLDNQPLASGNSWMRLDDDLEVGATELTLAGSPSQRWWLPNDGSRDQIIVTTTDYLPGHS